MVQTDMSYQEVWNEEELLEKMNSQAFYILIKGDFNDKVKDLLRTTLSDEEIMKAELGFGGTIGLFAEIIYKILSTFNNKSKIERVLESKIRQYKLKMEIGIFYSTLDN